MWKSLIVAAGLVLASGSALAQQSQSDRRAHGDVLLIEQVQKERGMHLPERGLSMAQVEAKFGAPLEKLETRGGGAPLQPPINRWRYAEFTVYFERSRVIHAVVNPPVSDPRPQA